MIPRAIVAGLVLLGLDVGRAPAQMPTDAAAAIAVTAEQERAMADQSRSVTRSAIGAVFGAAPSGAPSSAPPAVAPVSLPDPLPALPPDRGAIPLPDSHVPGGMPRDIEGADGQPANAEEVEAAAAAAAALARGRDPFRPFTLDLRPETTDTEILTPLQRYELAQLRLAGVVLELTPPRAMLQDNSGMGYIVTPGTPIGRRHGVVKSIEPRRLVIEEHVIDYYGREQTHQVVIEMAKEDKPQIAGQE